MDGSKPAFPQHVLNPRPETYSVASSNGMTLREWYAGMALQGMNANPELLQHVTTGVFESAFAKMAQRAFEQADAMIAEAAKK